MDPYSVLGCHLNDSSETIRQRYFELSRRYHPDRCAEGIGYMKRVHAAYDALREGRPSLLPRPFQELGFETIPTPMQYVRRLLSHPRLRLD